MLMLSGGDLGQSTEGKLKGRSVYFPAEGKDCTLDDASSVGEYVTMRVDFRRRGEGEKKRRMLSGKGNPDGHI